MTLVRTRGRAGNKRKYHEQTQNAAAKRHAAAERSRLGPGLNDLPDELLCDILVYSENLDLLRVCRRFARLAEASSVQRELLLVIFANLSGPNDRLPTPTCNDHRARLQTALLAQPWFSMRVVRKSQERLAHYHVHKVMTGWLRRKETCNPTQTECEILQWQVEKRLIWWTSNSYCDHTDLHIEVLDDSGVSRLYRDLDDQLQRYRQNPASMHHGILWKLKPAAISIPGDRLEFRIPRSALRGQWDEEKLLLIRTLLHWQSSHILLGARGGQEKEDFRGALEDVIHQRYWPALPLLLPGHTHDLKGQLIEWLPMASFWLAAAQPLLETPLMGCLRPGRRALPSMGNLPLPELQRRRFPCSANIAPDTRHVLAVLDLVDVDWRDAQRMLHLFLPEAFWQDQCDVVAVAERLNQLSQPPASPAAVDTKILGFELLAELELQKPK